VLSQDGLAEGLSLTEGNCAKSSGSLKSEAEAADAAEEVKALHQTKNPEIVL
jgi:hypothetical protein